MRSQQGTGGGRGRGQRTTTVQSMMTHLVSKTHERLDRRVSGRLRQVLELNVHALELPVRRVAQLESHLCVPLGIRGQGLEVRRKPKIGLERGARQLAVGSLVVGHDGDPAEVVDDGSNATRVEPILSRLLALVSCLFLSKRGVLRNKNDQSSRPHNHGATTHRCCKFSLLLAIPPSQSSFAILGMSSRGWQHLVLTWSHSHVAAASSIAPNTMHTPNSPRGRVAKIRHLFPTTNQLQVLPSNEKKKKSGCPCTSTPSSASPVSQPQLPTSCTDSHGGLSARQQSNDPSLWLGDVNVVVQLSIFVK